MKARINMIIMLMAIIFGALEASAQSAKRGTPNESKARRASTVRHSEVKKDINRQKSTYQTSPSRSVSRSTAHNPNNSQRSSQKQESVNNRSRANHAKVSTAKSRNPKSTYKRPVAQYHGKTYTNPKTMERKVNSKNVVQHHSGHNNRYTSVRHEGKHYYYPKRKVNVHVHPMTYHNHYRVAYYPSYREIVWTRKMYRDYVNYYPGFTWHYPIGYRVETISAFDARYNIGEVSRVYGRVYGTWFNRETDNLLLFFGGEFPYQQFTMIIPGKIARRYNWRPEKYFLGQHVIATGLITRFEGKPEMIVKDRHQVDIY